MADYTAPVKDMSFLLNHVIDMQNRDPDLVNAILDEAAKLARDVIGPINKDGDQHGCKLENGDVTTPPGFKQAYAQYRDNGWNSVPFAEENGGQELPWSLAYAVQEMWQSACMSFGLCPMLNQSAVEALEAHGSDEQKKIYLEKLISGQWTGTMNLTEPQAGSDLSCLKTKAVRQEDGSYKITGQKIYITYGEHDFTENIIHMVLATTPEAPEGVKGLSLFLVPKFIPDENGAPGKPNDLKCSGIEHKLGIHGSPTCTMQFGDEGGATGWIVGEEYEGLKLMFTMMNNARLAVGLQGVAISERACQDALSYARDRIQGRPFNGQNPAPIIDHPDVKRMLLDMKSLTEAGRALAYEAAASLDKARTGDAAAGAYMDLLTPVVKAWCTDNALSVTSNAIQVHGGMGFIEETGVAQHYRDARILPIYEGTNGIQANDLVFRKVIRDNGDAMHNYLQHLGEITQALKSKADHLHSYLLEASEHLESATGVILDFGNANPEQAAAIAKPYLDLFGITAGGAMMAKCYLAALDARENENDPYLKEKLLTSSYYLRKILPTCKAPYEQIHQPSDDLINWPMK